MKRVLLTAALLAAPAAAKAQALQCAVPTSIDRPHPDTATTDQPQRLLPIGGYTLALTWSPQTCRTRSDAFQCGGGNRFGFTLHGLWPDGVGKDWPQYCRATPLLSPALIRRHLCATPSAQLMQHEWSKHGTCMPGLKPADYFARSTGLYGRLRYPDLDVLSRQALTAGQLAGAIAGANPGLPAGAIRVTTTRDGWLDELWLCLDRSFRYERCRANSGGVSAATAVKIWRGHR